MQGKPIHLSGIKGAIRDHVDHVENGTAQKVLDLLRGPSVGQKAFLGDFQVTQEDAVGLSRVDRIQFRLKSSCSATREKSPELPLPRV